MSRYVGRHERPFDHRAWVARICEIATHGHCADSGQSWCLPSCREQWHGGRHAAWQVDEVTTRLPHDEGCDA